MGTYVAFLRGINVGGHHKVKMDELKRVHESMGHWNVATILQSGNIVFECSETDRQKLIQDIAVEYEKRLGIHTDVLVRSVPELGEIVRGCPFPLTPNREPKFLHVVLLSGLPSSDAVRNLLMYDGSEEWQISEDAMYVYYTQGSGRSKFNVTFNEKTLAVRTTARNWNTVTRILEMAATY